MSRDGFTLAVWNPVGETPTVKTSLDHLPTLKRLALQRVVDVLRAAFAEATSAYVKARHSRYYKSSAEELTYLTERFATLREAVGAVCMDHLEGLRAAEADAS